jgi:hypothetical protein
VQHSEPLRGYRAGSYASEKPAAAAPLVITFNAFSRDFALELEPNGRLAALAERVGGAATAYRGTVAGSAKSWVRLVLTAEGPSGLVFDGAELYGIEPDERTKAAAMFRLADVYFAPGELGCESAAAAIDGEQAVALLTNELTPLAVNGAKRNLDLGAVADFEFTQAFGSNAETAILTRFNNVDGIFSEQLGVQISVADVDLFTASDDPFTASSANVLLDELAKYRGTSQNLDALGLTHLLTGRDLDGSTAGVAFFGAVCARRARSDSRSFGAGLSEARRGAVVDSLVAAHEIGHNFGAPHDGDANGDCASTPTTFLMAPNINGSDRFSACSIQEMQAEIARATCLAPIGAADMTIALPPVPAVFAGTQFTHTATLRNDGADAATGVVFTATAQQGLAIGGADAGGEACTVSASSATCSLGSVGGGASRAVVLTMSAPAPGTFNLATTVTASGDADLGDNSAAVAVTAIPGIDLVWSAAATGVQLNSRATVTATLANVADFLATSVAVTATLTAGLRPEEATLGGVACTASGQSVACPTQAMAGRGTVALVLTVTGTTAGAQQVTFGAAANETDRAPADNQVAVGVTVSAPEQGGGGAASWLAVVALLSAYRARQRRRPS